MSRATNRHYLSALEREWGAPTPSARETVEPAPTVDLTNPSPAPVSPAKRRTEPKTSNPSAPPAGTWIVLCPQAVADYLDSRDPARGVAEVVIELIDTHSGAIREAFIDGSAYQQTGKGKTRRSFRPGRAIRYPVKVSVQHHGELQTVLDDIFSGVKVEQRPKSPIHVLIVACEAASSS